MARRVGRLDTPRLLRQRRRAMSHGLGWFWHRLRAMAPGEIRERIAHGFRKRADSRRVPDFSRNSPSAEPFPWPRLPPKDSAPELFRLGLRTEARSILSGRWRAFGHLQLQVDDPPRWFMDYHARREHLTARPGFRLDHRQLPVGSDIKLVWELSRWHALVRLAQAAWLLDDREAGAKCLDWLAHWLRANPPFVGWNWTSALEAGIRLINFAWIDALVTSSGVGDSQALDALRRKIVPPHLWYVSRHRSYGSSANNHLLGELAGLVIAGVRWPALAHWSPPVHDTKERLESEILAQFAPDGGNREQALHYQLFSWELAWQARMALSAHGRPLDLACEERLRRAADFFATVQVPLDTWDYGDSDSAVVTPFFADECQAVPEWHAWLTDAPTSPSIRWWLGEPPAPCEPPGCVRATEDWLVFPDSGQAVYWTDGWQARWDLSPMGYLGTAAHGHLDALHFSLWLEGIALVVDPGTGAYYGDTRLRSWLAGWEAHNGPHVPNPPFPKRLGPFLWGPGHAVPRWTVLDPQTLVAEIALPQGTASRQIRRVAQPDQDGWQIEDLFVPSNTETARGFRVSWQFAPGTRLDVSPQSPRFFLAQRHGRRVSVGFDAAWTELRHIPETSPSLGFPVVGDLTGLCSPEFRRILSGPRIELTALGANPTRYRTTFLIAPH